jgi:hypothetical protein
MHVHFLKKAQSVPLTAVTAGIFLCAGVDVNGIGIKVVGITTAPPIKHSSPMPLTDWKKLPLHCTEDVKKAALGRLLSVSKNPFGAFRQFFAVCCVQNLFVYSEQIPHLQPGKYFCPRTRRGQKCFYFVFCFRKKFCEAFLTV